MRVKAIFAKMLQNFRRSGVADGKISAGFMPAGSRHVSAEEGQKLALRRRLLPHFDSEFYLRSYPDVAAAKVDPLNHFIEFGARERRDPSPNFSVEWYVRTYPDVLKRGVNPLDHYIRYGRKEGRLPLPGAPGRDPVLRANTRVHEADNVFRRLEAERAGIAVIIPVYNAPLATENCIRSVLRHTDPRARIIVIDDASTDSTVDTVLAKYESQPGVTIIRNETNLGFTKTINKGIGSAGDADVVLLNSDTIVTPLWLQSLSFAAYSRAEIGTVTPFSDNAGAFSAPTSGQLNLIPRWMSLDGYCRAVKLCSEGIYPEVPTGNGFCLYIKRACLEAVGLLDEVAFPRGYGEENDFCMRAGLAGWKNVIDDATMIHHVRSASFGESKHDLMKAGRAEIDRRYPQYGDMIRVFSSAPEIVRARANVGKAATVNEDPKPRLLFVVSTQTGGTPQTNQDLMAALQDRYQTFLLRCDSRKIEFSHFAGDKAQLLETVPLKEPIRAFSHQSADYDARVKELLFRYRIELVHIRHIAWHSLNLPALCKDLGLPVVFSFHDFYAVCPTVNLLDDQATYCAGRCTDSRGHCKNQLWASDLVYPPLKGNAVHTWRTMMRNVLARCDAFVTTSRSAQSLVVEFYPELLDRPFAIVPHGRDLECVRISEGPPNNGEKLRILLPGNITDSKGAKLVDAIVKLAPADFEFHILGWSALQPQQNLVLHGEYQRREFADKVREIQPHLGAIFSIWPETWCHTLTELWACGLPVLARDLGAVGERLRAHGGGWLIEASGPERVLEELEKITRDVDGFGRRLAEVAAWQSGHALVSTTLAMSHEYDEIYRRLLSRRMPLVKNSPRPRVAVVLPSYGRTWPASSHVRVIQKVADTIDRPVRYDVVPKEAVLPSLSDARYDAVIVQRTAIAPEDTSEFLERRSRYGKKLLFEIDDDLIGTAPGFDPNFDYAAHAASMNRLVNAADVVLTSTTELAQRISALNSRVETHENALSERLWAAPKAKESSPILGPRAPGEIRIVYMGSKTHSDDLRLVEAAFGKLKSIYPQLRLLLVGVTWETAEWFETLVPRRSDYEDFTIWFRSLASELDFAIAPLRDTPFNRAKSALKFYEYSAVGLCGLYSDVVPYSDAVVDGVTGYLVRNSDGDWFSKISSAILDREKSDLIANTAHAHVMESHLMHSAAKKLDATVLRVLGKQLVNSVVLLLVSGVGLSAETGLGYALMI